MASDPAARWRPHLAGVTAQLPSPPALHRTLGLLDLTLIGVGASIGAGIFVLTGISARKAGPAVVLSFGLAAAVCALDALCYAELGSRIPRSGSAYLYARVAFGEAIGLITGANLLFDYGVGAAAISRSLVGYVSRLLHDVGLGAAAGKDSWTWSLAAWPAVSISAFAPLILLVITAVLCLGIKETRIANNMLTLTKMTIVLIVIAAGAPHAEARHLTPFAPHGAPVVLSTAATVFFAYVGFDAVSNAAEECRDPQRDLPRGILLSLLICAILYGALTIVLCAMV
jgi:APA family basic amino acid/polyamine antiporter